MIIRKIFAVFTALVLSASLAGCSAPTYPDLTEVTPTEEAAPVEVDWAPAGYTQADEYLAYKFTTNQGAWPCEDCNFWKVTVIANEDCSGGVYAEMNLLDSAGTIVDWTNDTVPYLAAGQKAILKFEHYPYDSSLKSGQLTKLECN